MNKSLAIELFLLSCLILFTGKHIFDFHGSFSSRLWHEEQVEEVWDEGNDGKEPVESVGGKEE